MWAKNTAMEHRKRVYLCTLNNGFQNINGFDLAITFREIYRTSELPVKMLSTMLYIIIKVQNNIISDKRGLVK